MPDYQSSPDLNNIGLSLLAFCNIKIYLSFFLLQLQDTINNNSFGEKERRKEKKTHSSSPHIKGE